MIQNNMKTATIALAGLGILYLIRQGVQVLATFTALLTLIATCAQKNLPKNTLSSKIDLSSKQIKRVEKHEFSFPCEKAIRVFIATFQNIAKSLWDTFIEQERKQDKINQEIDRKKIKESIEKEDLARKENYINVSENLELAGSNNFRQRPTAPLKT